MAQEAASLTIKLIGFEKHEADKFSAILDLAEFALQPAWTMVDADAADFYLLTEKPTSNNHQGLPLERCLFYTRGMPNIHTENGVQVDSDGTPSLQSLVKSLNRIAAQTSRLPPAFPASSLDEMVMSEKLGKPSELPIVAKASSE